MPVLILARHAKAEPSADTDFERSLTSRGLAQADEAGAEIAERWPIDSVTASAARRTVQTGQATVAALNSATLELRTDPGLYAGAVANWIDTINAIPSDSRAAYIVGHQPAVAEVIGHLCPEFGIPAPFKPSSIAVFELSSWQVEPGHYPIPELIHFQGA